MLLNAWRCMPPAGDGSGGRDNRSGDGRDRWGGALGEARHQNPAHLVRRALDVQQAHPGRQHRRQPGRHRRHAEASGDQLQLCQPVTRGVDYARNSPLRVAAGDAEGEGLIGGCPDG